MSAQPFTPGRIWRRRGGFERIRIVEKFIQDGADFVRFEPLDGGESRAVTIKQLELVSWLEGTKPLAGNEAPIIPGSIWHNTRSGHFNIRTRIVRVIRRDGHDFVEFECLREHIRKQVPIDEFRAFAVPESEGDDESAI